MADYRNALHSIFSPAHFPQTIAGSRLRASLAFALAAALAVILCACFADRSAAQQPAHAILLAEKGITVYAAGDIAQCRKTKPEHSGAARTATLIADGLAKDKEAVVLTLGDNTYPVGMPAEFDNCYEPTWGRFKERTYPSPGNHDYYTPEAIGYYGYFGAIAGPAGRGYYSFDLGGWHVVSLNSNLNPAQHQAQLAWLKDDLDRHKKRCTLAYWHHPLFSSGGHGNNAKMAEAWKMLAGAGADVVLTGHDHDYERFAPQDEQGRRDDKNGLRQFVVGTGGAQLTPLGFPKWNSEVSSNTTLGVLKLTLKERGYEWEFLPVEEGGFTDRGAALCR